MKANSTMGPFQKAALYTLPILATVMPMKTQFMNLGTVQDAMAQDSAHAAIVKVVPTSLQTQPEEVSSLSIFDKAQDYSMNNDGIGVFINLAKIPEIPPEKLIAAIRTKFAERGVPAEFHVNQSQGDLTTVTYLMEGTPFKHRLSTAFSGFQTVTKAYEQRHQTAVTGELHSSLK